MVSLGFGDHQATLYGSCTPSPSPSPCPSPSPTMAIAPSATWSSYRNSLRFLANSLGAGSGSMPRRYAPSRLAGLRSPQKATGPSLGAHDTSNDDQSGQRLTAIGSNPPFTA